MVTWLAAREAVERALSVSRHEPRESAQISRYLLEDVFGKKAMQVQLLSLAQSNTLQAVIQRLVTGEPWQYISGRAHFYGLDFMVNKDVLIPRMETEELVYQALLEIPVNENIEVLDIGTGSGIIACTVAKNRPGAQVLGIDISEKALEVARENQRKLEIPNVSFRQVDFLEESLWQSLPDCPVILSNPPYIPVEEKPLMSSSTVKFEPALALFTGEDALEFYVKIAKFAMGRPYPVTVVAEINEFRAKETEELFYRSGFKEVLILKDLQGKDRMVKAKK